MDIFETSEVHHVIVLQTVLDEVRNRNHGTYSRIRKLVASGEKHFWVFSNEFHKETFVERLRGEAMNDRNDRAIRTSAKWYMAHLQQQGIPIGVVVLTNDAENKRIATSEGIACYSIRHYVEGMPNNTQLLDIVARDDVDAMEIEQSKKVEYGPYYSTLQINSGVKNGTLLQGALNISMHNYLEGSIMAQVDGRETTVMILGRNHLNRAIHGDVVAVKLLPKAEWRTTPTTIVQDEDEEEDATKDMENSEMQVQDVPVQPTAMVVGVIKRKWRQYCGFVDAKSVKSGSAISWQNVFFYAMDRRIPKIRIRTRQANMLAGQRIIVTIDSWATNSRFPVGHFVRALGAAREKSTETEVLLLEHDVRYQDFSQRVMACLPPEGDAWVVRPEHLQNRQDLRNLLVCSIDPPGCTDIDDALHVERLANGNYRVGVHIADVTHFVKPNTPMDMEAAARGNTVYLVDKRIDMLPALLGTNLCSLRSNVERLAFSCLWEMTPDADIVDVTFTKSVIRSKESFTYEQAQNRIDDASLHDELTQGLRILNQMAKKLRAKRIERGALTLASPEVRFSLENDTQDPVDVEMKELKETNALVEEFMLLANISVAHKILERFPESAMLRRHPIPPPSNFDDLVRATAKLGLDIKHGNSKELSDSLDKAVIPSEPYFNKLLRIMTTRSMMQAVYFCSGTAAPHDYLHYGLATDLYTHFTSPIRRYADIIVHRQLAVAIDSAEASVTPDIINQSSMKELCDNINYRHRMAQHAGRSSVELFTLLFFQNRNIVEEGFVTRILKNGFIVLIPKYGIEGIVYASNASKVQLLSYNPQSDTLEHGQHAIALFQKVTVMVSIEDDKRAGGDGGMRQKLQLTLLDPWIEGLAALTRDKAQAYVRESRLKRDAVQRDEERLAKKIKAQQIE